ncbi:hypothetical protein JGC56_13710 [Salmonella enterica subsp. enterica serovar Saintpaul]|nr:hypothetical protein [Salmonella enterica subsp. enterica serovar Saintpaul]
MMKITSKDLLAWDIVYITLETVDPAEKKYLSDIIHTSTNSSEPHELSGAFDSGQMLEYTSQYLFPAVRYVLGIIVPIYLEGMVTLNLEQIKKRYKDNLNDIEEHTYQIKHSPDDVKKIVLQYCQQHSIAKETAESITNAILVRLFITDSR